MKPPHGFCSQEEIMSYTTVYAKIPQRRESARFSPLYSCLAKGGVKAYAGLANETIHCTAGRLWVTFEGDTKDYILRAGEQLDVPNLGKLLVSGPGCYRISKSMDGMDLAAAS